MKIWLILLVSGHVNLSIDLTSEGMSWCESSSRTLRTLVSRSPELQRQYNKGYEIKCITATEKPK